MRDSVENRLVKIILTKWGWFGGFCVRLISVEMIKWWKSARKGHFNEIMMISGVQFEVNFDRNDDWWWKSARKGHFNEIRMMWGVLFEFEVNFDSNSVCRCKSASKGHFNEMRMILGVQFEVNFGWNDG